MGELYGPPVRPGSVRLVYNHHAMACPYFMPTTPADAVVWPHRDRLPLGDGFYGECTAPGGESKRPDDNTLRDACNLGYARCALLPAQRAYDAVRFTIARERGPVIAIQYACELAHAPAAHGVLEFDSASQHWRTAHADGRVQRMAECVLAAHFRRRQGS